MLSGVLYGPDNILYGLDICIAHDRTLSIAFFQPFPDIHVVVFLAAQATPEVLIIPDELMQLVGRIDGNTEAAQAFVNGDVELL